MHLSSAISSPISASEGGPVGDSGVFVGFSAFFLAAFFGAAFLTGSFSFGGEATLGFSTGFSEGPLPPLSLVYI